MLGFLWGEASWNRHIEKLQHLNFLKTIQNISNNYILKKKYLSFNVVCMCRSVNMCMQRSEYQRVIGGCELPDVSARNHTLVLSKMPLNHWPISCPIPLFAYNKYCVVYFP